MLISKLDYITIPEKSKLTDSSPRFTNGMKKHILCKKPYGEIRENSGDESSRKSEVRSRKRSEERTWRYNDRSPKTEENFHFIPASDF
jgi:hypothetical protein